MTTSADSSPRLVAGRYRLGAVLGRGAMGTVWSAHDEVLGRPVAIKEVLLPPGIPDAEADALRERSLREARAIAALSHPNVVTLYDVAREGSAPFVVMELVASRSLAELLRENPLPPQRAAEIGAAVAAALQAAHAAGITHRDVKPGNVLVAHDGRIKLTDFGIARNPADQTITGTGLMLGSPAYIAPEVASGGKVSAAADLWGLGATLFAAVEGRPPYDSGDPVATVSSVVLDEVPTPSCGGPLAEVIGGLMRKDPAARMPLSRVRMLLGAPPVPQAPPGRRPPPPGSRPAAPPWPGPPPRPSPPSWQGQPPAAGTAGQLAADPGPLPFAASGESTTGGRRRRSADGPGRTARAGVWLVAVLLFLLTAATGFAAARVAVGATPLPALGVVAPHRPAEARDLDLVTRTVGVAEADGTDRATFTLGVPQGWSEFIGQGVLGSDTGSVVRFPSPDGTELITVERATGFLRSGDVDDYLARYRRALHESVPEAVQARREQLPGGMVDATFRTMDGRGSAGELRRTEYLRLVPAGTDLWIVRVTVPTEREATGRNRLFEPVVQRFVPHG